MFDYIFKICLVGRTKLLKLLEKNIEKNFMFFEKRLSTIGTSFCVKDLKINDKQIKTQLWLVSANDKFSEVKPIYCEISSGYILVFDLNNTNTLQSLDKEIQIVSECDKLYSIIPVYILGIDTDNFELIEEEEEEEEDYRCEEIPELKKVEDKEIYDFVRKVKTTYEEFNFTCFKIDEKSTKNFTDIFFELVKEIIEIEKLIEEEEDDDDENF